MTLPPDANGDAESEERRPLLVISELAQRRGHLLAPVLQIFEPPLCCFPLRPSLGDVIALRKETGPLSA